MTSEYVWNRKESYFGGMSGITLDAKGERFTAIGDDGQIIKGRIRRENGAITGLKQSHWIGGLLDPKGKRVAGRDNDSEGIAGDPDGPLYISFERNHRVWRYADWDSSAERLSRPRDFNSLRNNKGLEALALDNRGRLYAIPEDTRAAAVPFPVYRLVGDDWDVPFSIPKRGNYQVTGADFDDNGNLFVLERWFRGLLGFSTRVRCFVIKDDRITREETVLKTRTGTHTNLEGLSVSRAPDTGIRRLTMIVDNNYSAFMRTLIVEYSLTP